MATSHSPTVLYSLSYAKRFPLYVRTFAGFNAFKIFVGSIHLGGGQSCIFSALLNSSVSFFFVPKKKVYQYALNSTLYLYV